eukprot:157071-Chlamydomonas_euryale.AAC.1
MQRTWTSKPCMRGDMQSQSCRGLGPPSLGCRWTCSNCRTATAVQFPRQYSRRRTAAGGSTAAVEQLPPAVQPRRQLSAHAYACSSTGQGLPKPA